MTSRKLKERHDLADRIVRYGIIMVSCSNCVRRNQTCISSPDSQRCAACVRRGAKCDQNGPSLSDWKAVDKEEERLEREEEETAQRIAEGVAKLARLRRQKKFLKRRAGEMLRRGLKSLDELDAAEASERASISAVDDPFLAPLSAEELASLDAEFLANLDVVGGTGEEVVAHSQGVS
jgi:hypothetical protein